MAEEISLSREQLCERLGLKPHPEGGFFREYERIEGGNPERSFTGAYYLLSHDSFSAFHRLRSADEVWCFHSGSPVKLHLLGEGGCETRTLSLEQSPALTISPMTWMAAETEGEWSLVSCVVVPAFSFDDLEIATQNDLTKSFPSHFSLIQRLTRE